MSSYTSLIGQTHLPRCGSTHSECALLCQIPIKEIPRETVLQTNLMEKFISCDSLFLGTSSWQPRLTIHMQLCKNSACLKLSECLPYKAEPVPAEERGFEPSMHPKGFSHELYKIMFVHIFLFKISLLGTAWLKKSRKCGLNKYLTDEVNDSEATVIKNSDKCAGECRNF